MHCYLKQREENGIWYIYTYDAASGQCSRVTTRTRDRGIAERQLAEHILRLPQQTLNDATLVHIMLRYWEHHGKHAFSSQPIRRTLKLIVLHEPETRLYQWTIPQQKAFAARIGTPGTQRRYMGVIKAAVQWSFGNGEIPTLPAIYRPHAEDGAGVEPYSVEQMRALMAAATHSHERLFLLLCLTTAARPSAVLRLTWDRIRDGIADLNAPGRRRTNKRHARAPLAPTAAAYLEAHRSLGPVIQWRGLQIRTHKMTFARLARRAGIEGTAYGIRKGVATWLRQQGVPEMDIRGLLGHAGGAMTERYAHYRPEYMRAAAHAVEALLREICPPWLASYLPAVQVDVAKLLINGGSYRIRTYDQFLKRDQILEAFQGLKVANDD